MRTKYKLSRGSSWKAPVIARHAWYWTFSSLFINDSFTSYHALHHHNQGVVERGTYRFLVKIFLVGEQKVFLEGEQISV